MKGQRRAEQKKKCAARRRSGAERVTRCKSRNASDALDNCESREINYRFGLCESAAGTNWSEDLQNIIIAFTEATPTVPVCASMSFTSFFNPFDSRLRNGLQDISSRSVSLLLVRLVWVHCWIVHAIVQRFASRWLIIVHSGRWCAARRECVCVRATVRYADYLIRADAQMDGWDGWDDDEWLDGSTRSLPFSLPPPLARMPSFAIHLSIDIDVH